MYWLPSFIPHSETLLGETRDMKLLTQENIMLVIVVVVLVIQSCPTLWDSTNCSPTGSSVHGILQARILEWVAIPFSRGFSWCRDLTWVSCLAGRFFTVWAIGRAKILHLSLLYLFFFLKCRALKDTVQAIKIWTGLTFKFCYVFKAISLCELSLSP